jgi:hypothetical protein
MYAGEMALLARFVKPFGFSCPADRPPKVAVLVENNVGDGGRLRVDLSEILDRVEALPRARPMNSQLY